MTMALPWFPDVIWDSQPDYMSPLQTFTATIHHTRLFSVIWKFRERTEYIFEGQIKKILSWSLGEKIINVLITFLWIMIETCFPFRMTNARLNFWSYVQTDVMWYYYHVAGVTSLPGDMRVDFIIRSFKKQRKLKNHNTQGEWSARVLSVRLPTKYTSKWGDRTGGVGRE